LAENGRDDSPEAVAIRDGLERPWYDLSAAEKKRISGLSEDLYAVTDPLSQPPSVTSEAQRKLLEAVEARHTGDWDKALELLRCWGRYLDPAELSFQRGFVWREAGDYETAVVFFQHAARLAPHDERFSFMYLSTLFKVDQHAALKRADEILTADEVHQPVVIAQAANIRVMSTLKLTNADARPTLKGLAQVLERVLQRLQSDDRRYISAFESTHALVTSTLGFCYARLGDFPTALRYCNLGLAANPGSEALLVTRGILRYGADLLATDDFKQAISAGSTVVWPYFFLAHHHLVDHRFDECRRMCERALELSASDEIRADLYEWLAISEAELGFPPELIRGAFEEAIRLAPDAERIGQNLAQFEKAVVDQRNRPVPWINLEESVVQEVGRAGYSPIPA
jgi:tetratricopeptide (TPR) repeat protein